MAQQAHFSKGAEVEVSSDEDGYRDAWFSATVISTDKRCLQVQYLSMVKEEGGSEPLKEWLDVPNVMPCPPVDTDHSFELNEVVDAYHNDAWWRGVINKVLDDSRFSVLFYYYDEEIEFVKSDIRVHLEWIWEWIRPVNQAL